MSQLYEELEAPLAEELEAQLFEVIEVQTGSTIDLTRAVRNGRYVLIHLSKHPYPILSHTLLLA